MIIDNNSLRYTGRFDFTDESCVRFSWPGTSIKIHFEGRKLGAELDTTGDDYFLVVLDGKIYNNSIKIEGRKLYMLADNLEEGEHTIELFKRTESFIGIASFYGFELFDGKLLEQPKALDRRIEIIGDSISCGFGNEVEYETNDFNPKNENSYFAYGPIAARKLNADIHISAWSGLGLVHNFDSSPEPMPERFDWISSLDPDRKWDYKKYIPHVVAINLCTNDFNDPYPTKEDFVKGYIDLINRLKEYYGDIKVICSIGSIVEGITLELSREYVRDTVVKYFNEKGDKNVSFLEYEHQKAENGYGESYHPSLKTHELMAEQLVVEIKKIMNW